MSEMNTTSNTDLATYDPNAKSATVAYLLWFFLGSFGAHRFYMGRTGSGFGMLGPCLGSMALSVVVIGLLGLPALFVWWLVDAFLISRWLKEETSESGEIAGTIASSPVSQAA